MTLLSRLAEMNRRVGRNTRATTALYPLASEALRQTQTNAERYTETPEDDRSTDLPALVPPPETTPFENVEFSVIESLAKQDRVLVPQRSYSGYVHLSALLDMPCVRRQALMSEANDVVYRHVGGGQQVVWAMGKAAEQHVKTQFIAQHPHNVVGNWSCACGLSTHEGVQLGNSCARCGTKVDIYGELVMMDHAAGISGSIDLSVLRSVEGLTVLRPVEIKTMNRKDFDELSMPKADNAIQAAGYHRMVNRGVTLAGYNYIADNATTVLYVCKDYKPGSIYKEYTIDPYANSWQVALNGMWDVAMTLKIARESKQLPPRTKCSLPSDKMASRCPVVGPCFGRR